MKCDWLVAHNWARIVLQLPHSTAVSAMAIFGTVESGPLPSRNRRPSTQLGLEDINLIVLVNNAGGAAERTLDTLGGLSANRLTADASVNALFPILLLRQLTPVLCHSSLGLIINIGWLADLGVTKTGSYSASKAFLMKLTESLGCEMRVARHDIEVLGVRVGNVWGTGQTVAHAPGIFAPDAATMAEAVLARVGYGRAVVVRH
ncbi:hypothetical protein ASPZODRAFT_145851 [Penicilliopsis zonata CBS 506.65]|uniref:Ketoreductase (KR) domain-containing protein n=1 Tax=Penicilliopsis zonata CBS 506.65 TaxID=1073090 RepID=A0A1L9S8M0_9EURO|nr:hypothetical protein ASPZODRAFT_145851 [Penicilliopsis zonata CBS 506.65]OJJ43497.1 hypothetical protein ASPZODRAFT_145851 [Penicilliopsis zonata CBS 506.65]